MIVHTCRIVSAGGSLGFGLESSIYHGAFLLNAKAISVGNNSGDP